MKNKIILNNSFTFVLAIVLLSPIILTVSANVFSVVNDFVCGSQIDETLPLISTQKGLSETEIVHQLELFKNHTRLKNVIILGFPEIIPWDDSFKEFLFNIGLSGPNYDFITHKFYEPNQWLLLDYNPIERKYEDFLRPNKTLIEDFIFFKDQSHTFSYCGFEEPIKKPKKNFYLLVGKYEPIHKQILRNMEDLP